MGVLAGSTTGNGVSNLAGNNPVPSTAYHSGTLYVVWQGYDQIRSEIYGKRFSGGAWQNIGDVSFSIPSATKGAARKPSSCQAADNSTSCGPTIRIAARTGTQVAILANCAGMAPRSSPSSRSMRRPPASRQRRASNRSHWPSVSTGKPYVSWSSPGQDTSQVFLLANTFVPSGASSRHRRR